MEEDNIYKKIQEAISHLPDNFSILEEQINVELQLEYFNFSRELKANFSEEQILDQKSDLFNTEVPVSDKKKLLVLLASIEKVEAFRTIEKYAKNPDAELKDWATLALQESRMVIQSSLMDEQQVYISTGLGGKGQNLRYFVAFIANEVIDEYSSIQQKMIRDELQYGLKGCDGLLEEISFTSELAVALLLLPVKTDIQALFSGIINECNQYGDFIRQDIIITNVKKMTVEEIRSFINREKK